MRPTILTRALLALTASLVIAVFAGATPGKTPQALAAEQPAPPDQPLRLEYLKKAVDFPHAPHTGAACVTCHHTWTGSEPMPKCSDSGCHDVMDPKDKTVRSFYNMVHGRGSEAVSSCLACHKEEAKKQPEKRKELTGCVKSACHPN